MVLKMYNTRYETNLKVVPNLLSSKQLEQIASLYIMTPLYKAGADYDANKKSFTDALREIEEYDDCRRLQMKYKSKFYYNPTNGEEELKKAEAEGFQQFKMPMVLRAYMLDAYLTGVYRVTGDARELINEVCFCSIATSITDAIASQSQQGAIDVKRDAGASLIDRTNRQIRWFTIQDSPAAVFY